MEMAVTLVVLYASRAAFSREYMSLHTDARLLCRYNPAGYLKYRF